MTDKEQINTLSDSNDNVSKHESNEKESNKKFNDNDIVSIIQEDSNISYNINKENHDSKGIKEDLTKREQNNDKCSDLNINLYSNQTNNISLLQNTSNNNKKSSVISNSMNKSSSNQNQNFRNSSMFGNSQEFKNHKDAIRQHVK